MENWGFTCWIGNSCCRKFDVKLRIALKMEIGVEYLEAWTPRHAAKHWKAWRKSIQNPIRFWFMFVKWMNFVIVWDEIVKCQAGRKEENSQFGPGGKRSVAWRQTIHGNDVSDIHFVSCVKKRRVSSATSVRNVDKEERNAPQKVKFFLMNSLRFVVSHVLALTASKRRCNLREFCWCKHFSMSAHKLLFTFKH